ncbi:hypothetical protein M9H77_08656 [Catharanthus roseus]|uniref:Uncharacterized protein n=1 Tax=Catharanthus roseus TaxID=4058 RepID=A0ACC0BYK9_CATRO|nr:hypothetical protein M9H77_08656 [Catharanthus roseus]
MSVHKPYLFYEGGFQRRPKARGYYRPHEEVPRHEARREDNLFDDFGEDPNVGQAYHGKTLAQTVGPAPTIAGRLRPVDLLEETYLPPMVDHPTIIVFYQGFNGYFKSFNLRLARARV